MKNNNFYTFGMIKPDGMSHKEDIIKMIYDVGLEIPYTEFDYLSDELIEENYRHCLGKPFYDGMKKNLQSGAVLKMLIFDSEGDAVKKYRKVLGATKSCEAASDTIRGKFGDKNITYKNVAHGSGNADEANDEVVRFYKKDIFSLLLGVREYTSDRKTSEINDEYFDSNGFRQAVGKVAKRLNDFKSKRSK